MTPLTADQREELKIRLKVVSDAAAPLMEAMRPFTKALNALEELRQEYLEAAGQNDDPGQCEHCSAMLLEGDPVCQVDDGGDLCAACAPTWQDIIDQYRSMAPEDWFELFGSQDQNEYVAAMVDVHHDELDAKAVFPRR